MAMNHSRIIAQAGYRIMIIAASEERYITVLYWSGRWLKQVSEHPSGAFAGQATYYGFSCGTVPSFF